VNPTLALAVMDQGASLAEADRLVVEHVPMARAIARSVWRKTMRQGELDEMSGDAMLGLVQASRKYRASEGALFRTFAARRIAGAVYDGLRGRSNRTRSDAKSLRCLRAAEDAFTYMRKPEIEEVAEALGISIMEYHKFVRRIAFDPIPIDEISPDWEPRCAATPLDVAILSDFGRKLNMAVARLDARERLIVRLCLVEEINQYEVAQVLGICKSRVSQLVREIISDLRGIMQIAA
jgi:RNA polymerase sigma factor for flagellar operon FliA